MFFKSTLFCLTLCLSLIAKTETTPMLEGVYSLQISCSNTPECVKLSQLKQLIVASHNNETLSIGVSARGVGSPKYLFSVPNFTNNGGEIVGFSHLGENVAEILLSWDFESKTLDGWIRDPAFTYDLRLKGELIFSPDMYYVPKKPEEAALSIPQVVGAYSGIIGGVKSTLIIRPKATAPGEIFAAWITNTGYRTDFHTGRVLRGFDSVELLAREGTGEGFLKWGLSFKEDGAGNRTLRGMGYSSYSGASYYISLDKVN